MRFYIIALLCMLLLGACSKTSYEMNAASGEISFYNASYTLSTFLPASGAGGNEIILPLSQGPASLTGREAPFFSQTEGFRQDFPDVNWRNDVPWTVFDKYSPGTYTADIQLRTRDSLSSGRFTFPVTVKQEQRQTFYLSDSLGTFHVTAVTHTAAGLTGKVRLRLVQLCPDADSVNLRIGASLFKGMQNMHYRSVSDYIEYPLEADSLLKIRIFNAGDTLNIIGRNDLLAQPGQTYTLIFWQYRMAHQYNDNEGHPVNVLPNGTLDVRKTE